jgi:hypothetical protein
VNCGPRSYFYHIAITCLLYSHCVLYSHTLLFSTRYTHNLCFKQTGEIANLIASWEQSTWLCVCRFCIAASKQILGRRHIKIVQSCRKLASITFSTEGKLAAILITPSSWGSQQDGHSPRIKLIFWRRCRGLKKNKLPHQLHIPTSTWHQQQFSGAVAGEKVEDICEGSFSHAHPLLCYCFALFYLFYLYHFISKTQKN